MPDRLQIKRASGSNLFRSSGLTIVLLKSS